MLKNKKIFLSLIAIFLCSCTFASTSGSITVSSSSSDNNISSNYSSTQLPTNSTSTSKSSNIPVKPGYNTVTIHNLDQEYTFRLHDEYFDYSDIPAYTLPDREIVGWYFDEDFIEPIDECITYYVGESLDIYAKVEFNENYFIKDFLVNSVSRIYINTENNKKVTTKEEYTNATIRIEDDTFNEFNLPVTNLRIKCRGNSSYVNAHLSGEPFENSKFSYKIKFC